MDLPLHKPEEALDINFAALFEQSPLFTKANAISEYLTHTNELVRRLLRPEFKTDAEALALILLGVISSTEFYFRRALSTSLTLCPFCTVHTRQMTVPLVSYQYYRNQLDAVSFSALEHKSLAGAKEIKSEIARYTGFQIKGSSSAEKALDQFGKLCEVRHSAVHARGFLSSLSACTLSLDVSSTRKLRVSQSSVLDLVKVCHNAVRAVNRFLFTEILDRWIGQMYLTGVWNKDKKPFSALYASFVVTAEAKHGGNAAKAYKEVQAAIKSRTAAGKASPSQN